MQFEPACRLRSVLDTLSSETATMLFGDRSPSNDFDSCVEYVTRRAREQKYFNTVTVCKLNKQHGSYRLGRRRNGDPEDTVHSSVVSMISV